MKVLGIVCWLLIPTLCLSDDEKSGWGLPDVRRGIETVDGYLESVVEFFGGYNGECQYRCRYGIAPVPQPDYKPSLPNGCASSLVGMHMLEGYDMGIPAMTKCCNQLDMCYDSCGSSKNVCDARFRICLSSICTDLRKTLGFISKIDACESGAEILYRTVTSFGCKPFMDSQRASCFCPEEEREEL